MDPITKKPGFNWNALMQLVAPVVGEIASGGDRGAFLSGYQKAQQRIEDARKQQTEADQRRRQAGGEYQLHALNQLLNENDPHNFSVLRRAAADTGVQAYGLDPTAFDNVGFSDAKRLKAEQATVKADLDELVRIYGPEILGAHVAVKGRTLAQMQDFLGILPREESTGLPYQPPKKADVNASTDFGRFLAKFAKDKGKTVDTLTTQDELAAKDQFAQAGRAPVDPQLTDMNKTLKQLQIDAATQRQRDTASGGTGGLTEDGLDYAATQFRVTGTMPALGMQSKGARTAVVNRAAQQTKGLGQSSAAAIQKQAAYKADGAALTQMRRMASSAEAFETKALAQADIVESLSQKVGRTQYPIINDALLAGKATILGDMNTQLLFNGLTTFTTEYAKIMEGSTGSAAGSSESARAAASRLISASLSKGTLAQTIALMRREMRLTIDGYGVTIDHITNRMGGAAPAPPPSTPSPPVGAGLTYEDYLRSKDGR